MTAHLSRRSLLGLVGAGAGAYLLSGCSDDASDDPDAPQTINWWHIQNTEPMLPVWAAMAQEYQGAHSNVKIEIQPLENEAFKAKLTTATQAGCPAGPLPDLGRRRAQAAGGRGSGQGPHRRRRPPGRTACCRPSAAAVHGRRQDLRRPVRHRHGRLLVQQGRSSPRRGITAPPATWAELPRRRQASSRPPGSPRSPWPARTSGRATTTGPTWPCASAGSTRSSRPPTTRTSTTPDFVAGRAAAQGTGRPPAVPEGLPRRRVRHAGRAGRDDGQRQGGAWS